MERTATEMMSPVLGKGTGCWYCPVCGYVDPQTKDTRCPRDHPRGVHPLFREANFGYFIRVGTEELESLFPPREEGGVDG